MATSMPDFSYTAVAAADLSNHQFKFVKLNTSGQAALVAAVGVDHHGVLQNKPNAAGQPCTIVKSGLTPCIAGGTITVGARVRITASGTAVVADSDESVGTAISAATSGERFTLLLDPAPVRVGVPFLGSVNVETLAATKTLVATDANFQKLDPGGASRDVNLPTFATSRGKAFYISNAADAAENLVVKAAAGDGGATIGTLNQNEAAFFVCTGAAWVLINVATIAQS